MNKVILNFQKVYKKKFLYNKAKDLSTLFNTLFIKVSENYDKKESIEKIEEEFDEITKILRNETNIKKVQRFLNYYYSIYPEDKQVAKKISARVFMSSFIMYGYPEITLDFSRKISENKEKLLNLNSENLDVYYFSKSLVVNFISMINYDFSLERMRSFAKSMNIYSNVFNLFIIKDKIHQLNKITFEYYQIKKSLTEIQNSDSYTPESKVEIIENLMKTLEKFKEMILLIIPNYDLDNLKFYEDILVKFEKSIHKSYWEKLREEIGKDKEKFIKSKISEIYSTYKTFGIKKIDEQTELLNGYINDFGYDDFENWINFGKICLNIILEIQTPSRNDLTISKFAEIKCGSYSNMEDFIIKIFEFIFEENHILFRDIYNTKLMLNMGINPFVKKIKN